MSHTEHSTLDSHGGVPHADRSHLLIAATTPALAPAPAFSAATLPVLPALSIDANGWLVGPGTKKEPAGISFGTGYHSGHPVGVLNHFTDGCGDPHDTLVSRGVSAHGYTAQDGTLTQFVSFADLSWHAYDEAYYDIGWENAAAPGVACDFTIALLARLAQLNAVIFAWVKTKYGFTIPAARAPGLAFSAGIKCHADGLDPTGNPDHWDPNGHWDAPWKATGDPISAWVSSGERAALDRSPWSSADFVAAVQHYSAGGADDVTPEQAKTIADAQAFLTALTTDIGQTKDKSKAATASGAGHRVARVVKAAETPPPPAKRP